MKVWVLIAEVPYSDGHWEVQGVFATRDLAEKAEKRMRRFKEWKFVISNIQEEVLEVA